MTPANLIKTLRRHENGLRSRFQAAAADVATPSLPPDSAKSNGIHCGLLIGCGDGKTAAKLLAEFPDLFLYMIDTFPPSDPEDKAGEGYCRKTFAAATEATALYASRRAIFHIDAEKALGRLQGRGMDVVIFESSGKVRALAEDNRKNRDAWKERLKPGGLMIFGFEANVRERDGTLKGVAVIEDTYEKEAE